MNLKRSPCPVPGLELWHTSPHSGPDPRPRPSRPSRNSFKKIDKTKEKCENIQPTQNAWPNSGTNSGCEWWRPIEAIRRCGPKSTSSWMWWIATTSRRCGTWPTTGPFSSRRTWLSAQSSPPLKPGQFSMSQFPLFSLSIPSAISPLSLNLSIPPLVCRAL